MKLRVSDFGHQDCGHQTSNFGHQTSGIRLTASDFGYQTLDIRLGISEFGHQTSGIRLRVSDFGYQTSGIRLRASDFGHQTSGIRLRISVFGQQTLDITIDTSDLQGSPQKKKSSGRSHKNLNLAREQRNNMFTVASARAKKSEDFFIKTQQSIVVSRPITHSPTR